MRTPAQIEAARANARKSKGPITPEGKRIVSQNATKHGLLAATICRHGENREAFETLVARYTAQYEPQTPTEEDLIQQMAVAKWKELRAGSYESTILDAEAERIAESVRQEFEGATQPVVAALSFGELADKTTRLTTVHRYEAHNQRIWRLALKQLHEEQARRKKLPNNPEQLPQA